LDIESDGKEIEHRAANRALSSPQAGRSPLAPIKSFSVWFVDPPDSVSAS
jgi:hypothetical protein